MQAQSHEGSSRLIRSYVYTLVLSANACRSEKVYNSPHRRRAAHLSKQKMVIPLISVAERCSWLGRDKNRWKNENYLRLLLSRVTFKSGVSEIRAIKRLKVVFKFVDFLYNR